MTTTCPTCQKVYDDADRSTICPHNLIMPIEDLERKKVAIKLLDRAHGKTVRFAHQQAGTVAYRIQYMSWNGMIGLADMVGDFSPHLFVVNEEKE